MEESVMRAGRVESSWVCVAMGVMLCVAAAAQGAVRLVVRGEPMAVIVIPDEATRMSQYAAEELVAHVQKATGVQLPIVTQSDRGGAHARHRSCRTWA